MAFRREITKERRKDLLKLLNNSGYGGRVTISGLSYAEKFFRQVEERISGRIAGDIEDYVYGYWLLRLVARWMMAEKLNPEEYCFIEIGTLFGGSTILFREALEREQCNLPIYTIDPLNGYYFHKNEAYSSSTDLSTGLAIDVETLERNFAEFGYQDKGITIIKGLSEDRKVLETLKGKRAIFCFIDGDHSSVGICNDLKNYLPMVIEGGVVGIDNFVDINWPDVTREVINGFYFDSVSLVGFVNRTIYFKKVSKGKSSDWATTNVKLLSQKFVESWGSKEKDSSVTRLENSAEEIHAEIKTVKNQLLKIKSWLEAEVSRLSGNQDCFVEKVRAEIDFSTNGLKEFHASEAEVQNSEIFRRIGSLKTHIAELQSSVGNFFSVEMEKYSNIIDSKLNEGACCIIAGLEASVGRWVEGELENFSNLLDSKFNDGVCSIIAGMEESVGRLISKELENFSNLFNSKLNDSISSVLAALDSLSKKLGKEIDQSLQASQAHAKKILEEENENISRRIGSVKTMISNLESGVTGVLETNSVELKKLLQMLDLKTNELSNAVAKESEEINNLRNLIKERFEDEKSVNDIRAGKLESKLQLIAKESLESRKAIQTTTIDHIENIKQSVGISIRDFELRLKVQNDKMMKIVKDNFVENNTTREEEQIKLKNYIQREGHALEDRINRFEEELKSIEKIRDQNQLKFEGEIESLSNFQKEHSIELQMLSNALSKLTEELEYNNLVWYKRLFKRKK